MDVNHVLLIFDILGSIAFMFSGAIAAIQCNMDIGGVIFLSTITGVGGGTIRDVIINRKVFWLTSSWYIYLALSIAIVTFVFYHLLKKYTNRKFFEVSLSTFDTLGLVSFMVTGITVSQITGQTDLTAIILATITCIGGGMLRDLFCNKMPLVFTAELYATPVVIGCILYLWLITYSLTLAIIISGVFIFILRFLSIYYKIYLPKIRNK